MTVSVTTVKHIFRLFAVRVMKLNILILNAKVSEIYMIHNSYKYTCFK